VIPRSLLFIAAIAIGALFAAIPSLPVFAHSGGTNADGCHTNSRTGEYHCHGAKQPDYGSTTYCHVINGDRRCGYSQSTCSRLASRDGGYCERE
jgi:hypothetical protein